MESFPEEVTTQFGGDFLVLHMWWFSVNIFFTTWLVSLDVRLSQGYNTVENFVSARLDIFSIVFVYHKIFFPYL